MRALAILLLLSAVSGVSQEQKAIELPTISLTRTSCFGSCPAYTIDIRSDGKVLYSGRYAVAVQGQRTSSLFRGKVRELVRRFEEARFLEIQVVGLPVFDAPRIILEVSLGNQRRRLEVPDIDGTGSQELRQLANLIDEVTESWRWTRPSK